MKFAIYVRLKKTGEWHTYPSAIVTADSARGAIDYFREQHVIGAVVHAALPREHVNAVRVPDDWRGI